MPALPHRSLRDEGAIAAPRGARGPRIGARRRLVDAPRTTFLAIATAALILLALLAGRTVDSVRVLPAPAVDPVEPVQVGALPAGAPRRAATRPSSTPPPPPGASGTLVAPPPPPASGPRRSRRPGGSGLPAP